MIRVLVVDDSPFTRKAVRRVLGGDPGITVVGEAATGVEAIARAREAKPDVVTLDLEMPGMNGLETLGALRREHPELRILMLSAHTREGANATLDALAAGAVDFVDKARLNLMDLEGLGRELVGKIKACVVARRGSGGVSAAGSEAGSDPEPGPPVDHCEVCVVGASTGGPAAIQHLLERLPRSFPLPIAIVQHMPAGFTRAFADRLDGLCALDVGEAADGERLVAGKVVIAPGGQHLRLGRQLQTILSREPAAAKHVPSVDVLMHSATRVRPGKVLGILLTGMGDDGADGMVAIRSSGGITVGESEASCVVYGMPRAALLRGGVTHQLPIDGIARWLSAVGSNHVAGGPLRTQSM